MTFTHTIPNDITAITALAESARHFLLSNNVGDDTRYRVDLVIEELVSNVIRHGYDDNSGQHVSVTITLESDHLTVTVEDAAQPFNPIEAPVPGLGKAMQDRPPGGLGVHLVKTMTDDLTYERIDDKNVVHVRINYPASSAEAG